jgi:long-chain acyl-CoA synthetase
VALVMPNIKALNSLSKKLGLPNMPLEHLCANNQVIQTIHEAIKESGFQHNLKRNEIPLKITICPEEWTPDNGILTATMKLKRNVIANKFKSEIERMFGQNNSTKS